MEVQQTPEVKTPEVKTPETSKGFELNLSPLTIGLGICVIVLSIVLIYFIRKASCLNYCDPRITSISDEPSVYIQSKPKEKQQKNTYQKMDVPEEPEPEEEPEEESEEEPEEPEEHEHELELESDNDEEHFTNQKIIEITD